MKDQEVDTYILSGCCRWLSSLRVIEDNMLIIYTKKAPSNLKFEEAADQSAFCGRKTV